MKDSKSKSKYSNSFNESDPKVLFEQPVLASVLENTGILLALLRLDTTLLSVNGAVESLLQYEPGELIGKKIISLVHRDDKKKALKQLAFYTKEFVQVTLSNFLSGQNAPVSEGFEYRMQQKNGEWRWFETIGAIVDGKIFTVTRDVTERKDAALALEKSNTFNQLRADVWKIAANMAIEEDELIQQLLNTIGPAFQVSRACYNRFTGDPFESDLVCVSEWHNRGVKETLGYKLPAILVKHFLKNDFFQLTPKTALNFVPPQLQLIVKPIIHALVKAQNLESVTIFPHYVNQKVVGILTFDICPEQKNKPDWSDGEFELIKEIISIISARISHKNDQKELDRYKKDLEVLVFKRTDELISTNNQLQREIAEHKRTEDALHRAEKMEALGLLAGGVAHDLNNILAGIVTCPDLLLLELPPDSPMREIVDAIKLSGTKASAIVQDLLLLSKSNNAGSEVLNLNTVVSDYMKSLEYKKIREQHPQISIVLNLEEQLLNTLGSPLHLFKVVMNLVGNAADATPSNGTITITTTMDALQKDKKGYEIIPPGTYVILEISDTGKGISGPDLQRIFEPFYTKKIMGRSGTGLGLSIVWRSIKDHNGFIDIYSKENSGTRFTLYFPTTTEKIEKKETLDISISELKGNQETIAILDDFQEQLDIIEKILTALNYRVKTFSIQDDLIAYIQDNEVDLLILDMILGNEGNGLDTFKRILELKPNQKTIISSGYSKTEEVKEAQNLGAGKFIGKPFTIEEIGLAVKEELSK